MTEATYAERRDRSIQKKQQLHKYVWICMGCLFLMLGTFPLAYWRVSRSGKFDAGAFNSLTREQSQKSEFGQAE